MGGCAGTRRRRIVVSHEAVRVWCVMKRWTPLTDYQLAVLQRVADPGDLVSAQEPDLARTVYALRDRGLLTTPRINGRWQAQLADAGRFYLEHGHHPDHPSRSRQPSAADSQARRYQASIRGSSQRAASSSDEMSGQQLLALLREQDGRVHLDDPDEQTRGTWRRAIHALKSEGLVPAGMHLRYRGRDSGDLVIELVAGEHPDGKYRVPHDHVDVPALVPGHPVIQQLEREPRRFGVTQESRERALRLVQALVVEWERRGHTVELEKGAAGVTMVAGASRFVLLMYEEYEAVEVLPSDEELDQQKTYSWQRVQPQEREVPSGRLVLEIPHAWNYSGRRRRWADRARWTLEDKLGDVLVELEARARVDEERQRAQREEEAYRREQWEAAVARARAQFAEDVRVKALDEQLLAVDRAAKIRAYCVAVEATLAGGDSDDELVGWIAWARQYADRIDPLIRGVHVPEIPQPKPYDLKPYLGRWSPYEPKITY